MKFHERGKCDWMKKKKRKKYVHHHKKCTYEISDIGYTSVFQITVDENCPFHKHLIKD